MNQLIKLLSFRLNYKSRKETKAAFIYFFSVALLLLLFYFITPLPLMSLTFMLGALVYFFAATYFFELYLEKTVKVKLRYIFSAFHAMLILFAMLLLLSPVTSNENRIVSFAISAIALILPASLSDEAIALMKKKKFFPAVSLSNLSLSSLRNITVTSLPSSLIYEHPLTSAIFLGVMSLFFIKYVKEVLKVILLALLIAVLLKYLGVL